MIKRIVKIVDTREYVEVDDHFVPVPGSGDERECDRCSRTHEIHVYVEMEDDSIHIVGTGCMGADWTKEVRRRVNSVRRELALRAELQEWEKRMALANLVEKEIDTMVRPDPVLLDERETPDGVRQVWEMGAARVYTVPGRPFDDERLTTLVRTWRRTEFMARCRHTIGACRAMIEEIDKKLKKLG